MKDLAPDFQEFFSSVVLAPGLWLEIPCLLFIRRKSFIPESGSLGYVTLVTDGRAWVQFCSPGGLKGPVTFLR